MTSIIKGRGARYDVRPTGEASSLGGLFGICRDGLQGACAGLLGLLGATHITGAPTGFAEIHSNIPMLDSVWGALSAGGLAGPAELLGGIALFFAARRTIARTLGLLAFIAYIAAYVNGFTAVDMLSGMSDLLAAAADRLGDAAGGAA